MINFIFVLIFAGVIHSLGEDEFDYCETCKSLKEMSDKWPCTLCDDGMKGNPPSQWPDKSVKEVTPRDSDSFHNDKISPRVVNLSREDDQEKRKEDTRRMWLYTKIIISLILIIGSAFLCHYRYKRLKRMGAMIDYHETNMHSFPTVTHPPFSSFFRTPHSTYPTPDSTRNQYPPSDIEFPISGSPYAPTNVSYPPSDTRYPPPYSPYPHTLSSLVQVAKPLIMPALPPEANYRLLHGLYVPPPAPDPTQENSGPPQDSSLCPESSTISQVTCHPEVAKPLNMPELPPEANYRLLQDLYVPPSSSDSEQENSFPPQDSSLRPESTTTSQVPCHPEVQKPLIMPTLPSEANNRLLQGLYVPPPGLDPTQENSVPSQDSSMRSESATTYQVACYPEVHQIPNSHNLYQHLSDPAVEKTEREGTGAEKENNSTPSNSNNKQT